MQELCHRFQRLHWHLMRTHKTLLRSTSEQRETLSTARNCNTLLSMSTHIQQLVGSNVHLHVVRNKRNTFASATGLNRSSQRCHWSSLHVGVQAGNTRTNHFPCSTAQPSVVGPRTRCNFELPSASLRGLAAPTRRPFHTLARDPNTTHHVTMILGARHLIQFARAGPAMRKTTSSQLHPPASLHNAVLELFQLTHKNCIEMFLHSPLRASTLPHTQKAHNITPPPLTLQTNFAFRGFSVEPNLHHATFFVTDVSMQP